MSAVKSAIYAGRIRHERFSPLRHGFSYPIHMLYLDLDELATLGEGAWFGVERARPLSFRRADYAGRADRPLRDEIVGLVRRELGCSVDGPIRMLTHVRAFGYVFNPVTFYYCFARDGRALCAVVAEVTNTPWGERHSYVLPAGELGAHEELEKRFHVSPFFGMEQRYRWSFAPPGEKLRVHMQSFEGAERVFYAGLELERRPFEGAALLRHALTHPLMGLTVHGAIYWQALRLWWKGAPFFTHPNKLEVVDDG